jgi:hypothetical protein
MKPGTLKQIVLVVAIAVSGNAAAQQAVIDVPAIISAFESATSSYDQAMNAYEKMNQQYDQLVKLQDIASGQTPFLNILNNGLFLDALPEDLSGAMGIAGTSMEYYNYRRVCNKLKNPRSVEICELSARSMAMADIFMKRASQRQKKVKELEEKLASDGPKSPAEKADLANQLQLALNQMQADQRVIDALRLKMREQIQVKQSTKIHSDICNDLSPDGKAPDGQDCP